MRETFLFMAGGTAGFLLYALSALARNLYSSPPHVYRCECCGDPADGHIDFLGPVCAECELTIYKAEKIKEHVR